MSGILRNADLICFAATNNGDKARAFYGEVLGLALQEDSPFALVFDANGVMLRLQKTQGHIPAPHTALGWRVDDIRGEVQALAAKGVRFERYEQLPQDTLGVWITPDGAQVAWFKDPDGNVLSLTQWPA